MVHADQVQIQSFTEARLLRRRDVKRLTGMTRYLIDKLEAEGAFPRRIQLGERAVFWSADEVDRFVQAELARRTGRAAPQAQASKV
jgi:prophage regulatory protein